jgi:hypothetical protein
MEECSFAPQINRNKRRTNPYAQRSQMASDNAGGVSQIEQEGEEDPEEVRDVDTFIKDQQRFLEQKKAREEAKRIEQEQEMQKMQDQATKVNKRSLEILKQREERIANEKRLKSAVERKRSVQDQDSNSVENEGAFVSKL